VLAALRKGGSLHATPLPSESVRPTRPGFDADQECSFAGPPLVCAGQGAGLA